MSRKRRPDRSRTRGIALVTVLWLLALLTLLTSAVVSVTVVSRRATWQLAQGVQADLAADSGIRMTQLRLIEQPNVSLVEANRSLSVAGLAVEITVEQEAGRIDLNDADPQLLVALLAANGWEPEGAQAMVSRIGAWREERGRRFESLDELRQIDGSQRLAPLLDALTVYSHEPLPLRSAAPPAVQRALQWADEHELGDHRWLTADTDTPASSAESASLAGQVLRIRACAQPPSGAHCRWAIVRLTGSMDRPLQVFEWTGE